MEYVLTSGNDYTVRDEFSCLQYIDPVEMHKFCFFWQLSMQMFVLI